MKKFLVLLACSVSFVLINPVVSIGQCISTFPYEQNFEAFDSIQEIEACNTSVLGDTAMGWIQDQSDGAEWRADTAGTPSTATGPGATATTSGVGVGTDYKPGTTGGHYLYTEASSASGCANTVASLISPCFDFSGTKYYRMKLAYHMYGGGMGSLHVDVFDSSKWVTDVWSVSGDQGTSWNEVTINLANFNKSGIRIRIRAILGVNFLSDCAIDAFSIEAYNAPDIDLIALSASSSDSNFFLVPFSQVDSFNFSVRVKNEGVKDATDVRAIISNGGWKDSFDLGDVNSFAIREKLSKRLTAWRSSFTDTFTVELRGKEADDDLTNNTTNIITQYNDSVFSIDHGLISGGIGFNTGVGQIGQAFTLRQKDTLTSITFYSNNAVAGDSVRVHLMTFGANGPDTLLQTMNGVVYRGSAGWYNVRLNCETILEARKYFVAIEQLVAGSNMAIGYWTGKYIRNSAFFNGGATWNDIGPAGFDAVLLIRMNFGRSVLPKAEIKVAGSDTICFGKSITFTGSGVGSYLWSPKSLFRDSTARAVSVFGLKDFTVELKVTNKCNWTDRASRSITVKPAPSGWISNDTIACLGDEIVLKAGGGNGYSWVGGPNNKSWNYKVIGDRTVQVIIDSSNGCSRTLSVEIGSSAPTVIANNDTTVCSGSLIRLKAEGAGTYQWTLGPTSDKWSVRPYANSSYIVEGFNSLGCSAFDTVKVTTIDGPTVSISNDTAVCFGQRVTLEVSGGVSQQWIGGPTTQSYNLLPISTRYVYVDVLGANSCTTIDSVMVRVEKRPIIKLSNDTTICEGETVRLIVVSNDDVDFEWSTGQTGKVLNITPTESASYTMTAANSIGCASIDSVRVDVDPLPRARFDYTLKARDVTFTNTSEFGDTYSWDFGDGTKASDRNAFHRYAVDDTYEVVLTVTNNCGSDDTTVSIKIENLGIHDMELGNVRLMPNPARSTVKLLVENLLTGELNISLYQLDGKAIWHKVENKLGENFETLLELDGLAKGIYVLEVEIGKHRGSSRLIVE